MAHAQAVVLWSPDGGGEAWRPTTLRRLGKDEAGLSLVQPWASAVAYAGKTVENWSRRTHYRGALAIHASRTFDREDLTRPQRIERGGAQRPLIDWIDRGQRRLDLLELRVVCRAVGITLPEFVARLEAALARPSKRPRRK